MTTKPEQLNDREITLVTIALTAFGDRMQAENLWEKHGIIPGELRLILLKLQGLDSETAAQANAVIESTRALRNIMHHNKVEE